MNMLGALIGILLVFIVSSYYLALMLALSAGFFVFIAINDLLPSAIKLEEDMITITAVIVGFSIAGLLSML